MGNPHGDVYLSRDIYWKILRRQLHVRGTWNSRFFTSEENDWQDVVGTLAAGRIDAETLVTHNLPFKELMQGLQIMRDHTEFYSKIIISKK